MIVIDDMPLVTDEISSYEASNKLEEGDIFQLDNIREGRWNFKSCLVEIVIDNRPESYVLLRGDQLTYLRKEYSRGRTVLRFFLSREHRLVPLWEMTFDFWALNALEKPENVNPSKWCLRKIT